MDSRDFIVEILPAQKLDDTFSYLYARTEMAARPLHRGQLCLVPFGKKTVLGCVLAVPRPLIAPPRFALKPIERLLDTPPLSAANLAFIDSFAAYNMIARGTALKMLAHAAWERKPQAIHTLYHLRLPVDEEAAAGLTEKRRRVIAHAHTLPPLPLGALARECGVSAAMVKSLTALGVFQTESARKPPRVTLPPLPQPDYAPPDLSAAQTQVRQQMAAHMGTPAVTVVDGETGSGKTALYFEAAADIIAQGKQVLILLPEIALTGQFLQYFQQRFLHPPLLWHSAQSASMRRAIWQAAIEGQPYSFIGARSALFLPFANIGLIVVDEEHDTSYKQSEGNIYHARDMAVLRGSIESVSVVLASATPSLETQINCEKQRYLHVRLKQRYGGASLPTVSLIDLRQHRPKRGSFLTAVLIEALRETLTAGHQAILFLNRRGFAPLLLCVSCGHRFMCRHCEAWLVMHERSGNLQCHHCGYREPLPETCPKCEAEDLLPCGPGIERIEQEIRKLFSDKHIAVMSSDNVGNVSEAQALIAAMRQGEIDILIGTQILTKGYHFPKLAFVGVVDADISLGGGDLRAGEHSYQLLYQVMGRAGRELPGRVMMQTANPEHILFQALQTHDREAFYKAEKNIRKNGGWPPYGRTASLLLLSANQSALHDYADALKNHLPPASEVRLLGPAPAPLARLKGKWQVRFLLRTPRNFKLQIFIKDWVGAVKKPNSIRLKIDIDPL